MIQALLCIVLCYGIAIAVVHLAHAWRKRNGQTPELEQLHYVLVTKQNQMQVEWVVRALTLFAWLQGKTLKLTIFDDNSTDLTVPIIQRLTVHCSEDVDIIPHSALSDYAPVETERPPVWIFLNHADDWKKIPFAH